MLSSALIGCFTARLNVELCSDWLFHSAAQCWALLWLAVSQCGSMLSSTLIGCSQRGSMLSSALIGCFTVWLNVELCSDWLFHSAAQCWALLWLAVSQCGSMLSSALIGCFTVRLISVAHRKETQGNIYSQVHKYWDIDTVLTFLALYTTTMDFKWNEQDVL